MNSAKRLLFFTRILVFVLQPWIQQLITDESGLVQLSAKKEENVVKLGARVDPEGKLFFFRFF